MKVFFSEIIEYFCYNNVVRPIWTRLNSNMLGVYTAIVDSIYLGIAKNLDNLLPLSLQQNWPNPVSDVTTISFEVHVSSTITLRVLDIFGREVAIIVNNRRFNSGEYTEFFDAAAHQLTPGIYYFSLVSGETSSNGKCWSSSSFSTLECFLQFLRNFLVMFCFCVFLLICQLNIVYSHIRNCFKILFKNDCRTKLVLMVNLLVN